MLSKVQNTGKMTQVFGPIFQIGFNSERKVQHSALADQDSQILIKFVQQNLVNRLLCMKVLEADPLEELVHLPP